MVLQHKQSAQQQQRLLMAPNMTLALEVLRMHAMELQAFLQQQAQENPLLEVDESNQDEESSTAPEQTDGPQEEKPPVTGDEDWLSHWQSGSAEQESEENEPDRALEQRLVQPQSLYESLFVQLGCQSLSEEDSRIGEALIQSLNDHGYVEGPLEELAASLGVTLPHIEAVLRIIQRCDPPGVGARDLRECLMLQLEQAGASGALPYRILRDHFPLFVQHRIPALASALGVSLAEMEAACEALTRLNPKPGRLFANDLPPTIVPDLVIQRRDRHYDVELNDQNMPRVGINRAYRLMLKDPRTPEDAKEFLLKKFRQASWIIKAIDERNTTILAIGRCLISLQREFVEHGSKALKPLTQAQVAGLIGRHPSTVSRAIAGKTIDTPYGIFRLEQLFASHVPQDAQGSNDISDATIKAQIEQMIREEDRQHPLSDDALAKRMAQRHIGVARRTVAKYRTSLKILPGHLRRRRL